MLGMERNPLFIEKLLNQLTAVDPVVAVCDNGQGSANKNDGDEFSVGHAGQARNHDHDISWRDRGEHTEDKKDFVASFIINLAFILVKGLLFHKKQTKLPAISS